MEKRTVETYTHQCEKMCGQVIVKFVADRTIFDYTHPHLNNSAGFLGATPTEGLFHISGSGL